MRPAQRYIRFIQNNIDLTILNNALRQDSTLLSGSIVSFYNPQRNQYIYWEPSRGPKSDEGTLIWTDSVASPNAQFLVTYEERLQGYSIHPVANTQHFIRPGGRKQDNFWWSKIAMPNDRLSSFSLDAPNVKNNQFWAKVMCNYEMKGQSFFFNTGDVVTRLPTGLEFRIDIIDLGEVAWKLFIIADDNLKKQCCVYDVFGGTTTPQFQSACKTVNISKDVCANGIRDKCMEIGFDDPKCLSYCTSNPEGCVAALDTWCSKPENKSKGDVCSCWDNEGFDKFTNEMFKCDSPPCPLTGASINCAYPKCLKSSYHKVKSVSAGACPPNIVNYQKCVIENKIENLSAKNVINSCVQSLDVKNEGNSKNTPGQTQSQTNPTPKYVIPPIPTPTIPSSITTGSMDSTTKWTIGLGIVVFFILIGLWLLFRYQFNSAASTPSPTPNTTA